MGRYKEPPCGVFQTHGGHVWVKIMTIIKNILYFSSTFSFQQVCCPTGSLETPTDYDYDYETIECHSDQQRVDFNSGERHRCKDGFECTVGSQCGVEGKFSNQLTILHLGFRWKVKKRELMSD